MDEVREVLGFHLGTVAEGGRYIVYDTEDQTYGVGETEDEATVDWWDSLQELREILIISSEPLSKPLAVQRLFLKAKLDGTLALLHRVYKQ